MNPRVCDDWPTWTEAMMMDPAELRGLDRDLSSIINRLRIGDAEHACAPPQREPLPLEHPPVHRGHE